MRGCIVKHVSSKPSPFSLTSSSIQANTQARTIAPALDSQARGRSLISHHLRSTRKSICTRLTFAFISPRPRFSASRGMRGIDAEAAPALAGLPQRRLRMLEIRPVGRERWKAVGLMTGLLWVQAEDKNFQNWHWWACVGYFNLMILNVLFQSRMRKFMSWKIQLVRVIVVPTDRN